jgi:lipopolysaccharide biosynthesis glycosyltransferase
MVPTVVAAIQARQHISAVGAGVIILAMGLRPEQGERYARICSENNVDLVEVTRDVLGDAQGNAFIDGFFSGSKFTFGALGRLFLDQMVDPKYDQILYLDGDIHVRGSLDPLILADVPPGSFLAAPDPKSFLAQDDTRETERLRAYMSGIGLTPDQFGRYFNSGVLRINRSGWRDIGLAAMTFLRNNSELCIQHDQSALNAVALSAHAPMSIKWNFPPFYRYFGLQHDITPAVVHFMSHPKPWNGVFPPWTAADHQIYLDFIAKHGELRSELAVFKGRNRAKYILLQNYKWIDELFHQSRRRTFRRRVKAYQQTAVC